MERENSPLTRLASQNILMDVFSGRPSNSHFGLGLHDMPTRILLSGDPNDFTFIELSVVI